MVIEVTMFLYGLCAGLVLMIAERRRRQARPIPTLVNAMGWGLMSMSSALAVLLFAVALATAVGMGTPATDALIHG